MIAFGLALLALAIWLVLVLGRGAFWQARETDELLLPLEGSAARKIRVTAIVPARDEADVIARSVTSLLQQDCGCDFHVVVVDDQSSDGTGDVARRAAAAIGASDRLTVVPAENPPPGWTGKLNAMRAGLAYVETVLSSRPERSGEPGPRDAVPESWVPDRPLAVRDDIMASEAGASRSGLPDYILFTDADIAHAPDVLARLVGGAERGRLSLVSLMAQLACVSRAERWLVPAFIYFFDMLYPFAWVNDPNRRTAAAAGGCMLVRREALQRAGGLEIIRDVLIDDCALGAAMKTTGPIFLGLTHRVVSLRPYPHFADIRRMVVRSAYAELHYSPLRLAVATLGMAATFITPPALAGASDPATGLIALSAFALMVLSYRPMLRRYRLRAWRGVFLPVVAGLYMAFTLESALAWFRGKGGAWKGRYQAARSVMQ